MVTLGTFAKRFILIAGLLLMIMTGSGCALATPILPFSVLLFDDFTGMALHHSQFWKTTPLIPVSPYFSELVEDTYHMEERYLRAPILDPVEGEHAPLFCMDPPSPDEVIRALPDETGGGFPFLAETARNNVSIVVEPIVDRLDECRFYPMVGPARMHHCHYKCTVYYDKVIRSDWPIPFSHEDQTQEVVYIDHDHLIRCAGPEADAVMPRPPGPGM